MLSGGTPGDVVYAITDGGDNASRIRVGEMQRKLLAGGIRLYGFLVFDENFKSTGPEIKWGSSRLGETAELTGGGWIVAARLPRKGEALRVRAASVRHPYELMSEFYLVELELPRSVDKPRGWRLEVVDSAGKRRKDLQVIYPRKLVPCATPPPP